MGFILYPISHFVFCPCLYVHFVSLCEALGAFNLFVLHFLHEMHHIIKVYHVDGYIIKRERNSSVNVTDHVVL